MELRRKYPVGIQTFSELRKKGYIYVDKTETVYRMANASSKYVFLSRPRRFGKSLLASTLHSYFEGRRDLFKGLAIEKLETEWTAYPVLHFDMSTAKHAGKKELEEELEGKLALYEKVYGREPSDKNINQRVNGLIRHAFKQTGEQVVVLIDEYDAPLLDVVHEEEKLPKLRQVMRNFYSPLKSCDPYLRFVFITGITKFSQLSIFSELNNISKISMLPEYAAICGITKEELSGQLSDDIVLLSRKLGKTKEETFCELTDYYDGYHFTWPSPDVFNPYSLMNAFNEGQIGAYWFETGTPTYLVETLRKYKVIPQEIGGKKCTSEYFDAPVEMMSNIMPLFYQSGYLTIKAFSPFKKQYTLDIPNEEVRLGLSKSLLPEYVKSPVTVGTLAGDMAEMIYYGDMSGALELMRTVLSTLPYCDNINTEVHYQQLLALAFTLMGEFVDVEVHTPTGRVDMVMKAKDTLYLIELKIDKSAEAAMRQIDLKEYAGRFSLCGLPTVKVGITFDTAKRTISDWKIEKA